MGLKELSEHLGVDYLIVSNDKDEIIGVKIYSHKEKLWSYNKPISPSDLTSLFKSVYSDVIKGLIPDTDSLDKDEK